MPVLDKEMFYRRVKLLYSSWLSSQSEDSDAIVVSVGQEAGPTKAMTIQTWLIGYEINKTIILFCEKDIYFFADKKRIDTLKQLETKPDQTDDVPSITFLIQDKDSKDKANFEEIVSAIKKSKNGITIGEFLKDKYEGDFVKSWRESVSTQFGKVDVSSLFAHIMACKDETELGHVRKSCKLTMNLAKFLRDKITDIIDQDQTVKHVKLQKLVEKASEDVKYSSGIDLSNASLCYQAIVQSGGKYALKYSGKPDDSTLQFGTIIYSIGFQYMSYCSSLWRMLLVNPTQEQKDLYTFLLEVEQEVANRLQDGVTLGEVHQAAVDLVKSKRNDVLDKMAANIGFGMGMEFREKPFLIAPGNTQRARKGMVFNINVGFNALVNNEAVSEQDKTYALFIGDTVVVREKEPALFLTDSKKTLKYASVTFVEEKEEEKKVAKIEEGGGVTRNTRNQSRAVSKVGLDQESENSRKVRQKELAEILNEEAKARFFGKKGTQDEEKIIKSAISYKSRGQLPTRESGFKSSECFVDKKYESLLVPIFNDTVPFHASILKNVTNTAQEGGNLLRIILANPGEIFGRGNANQHPYIKEITMKGDAGLQSIFARTKELQKNYKVRQAEEREKEGIVKQDTLVLSHQKTNPKLKGVYIKPNIVTKRITGMLEGHVNGLRFTSTRGDKVDILYNNVKHAFFQPCDGEMVILLHFTLKHALMLGKKKTNDVQFYTEVGEVSTDLGRTQHMKDDDDIMAEQLEREMRNKLKVLFKGFCDKVEHMSRKVVVFDVPFKELGFQGVPFRSSVFLQPTVNCLVNLSEYPPLVVTLAEVELVHFERVSFNVKTFDMVMVFKDYNKKVAMINAIPSDMLDSIKTWINQYDLHYTEGPNNINWPKIFQVIKADPVKFFDDGGWSFLELDGDEGEEEEDGEDDEDEEYLDHESEESDEDGSEYSNEDYSEEDSSEENLGSDEESGKDWSDLEEEAGIQDRETEYEQSRKHKPTKRDDGGFDSKQQKRQRDQEAIRHSTSKYSKSNSSEKHRDSTKVKSERHHSKEDSNHQSKKNEDRIKNSTKSSSSHSKHSSSSRSSTKDSKHNPSDKNKSPAFMKSEIPSKPKNESSRKDKNDSSTASSKGVKRSHSTSKHDHSEHKKLRR